MWTPFFGDDSWPNGWLDGCPYADQCEVTYDRTAIEYAGAVVFHAWDVNWLDSLPTPAFESQKFVFFLVEAPINGVVQLWKLPKDYFHWTMTYLNSSDLASPYGGPWVPPEQAKERGLQPVNLTSDKKEILADKSISGAFWLVSDCRTLSGRERLVEALSKHFRVDIAGKCAKDESLRNICPLGDSCENVFRRYYFHIEAENANCKEYITEKYWRRFHLPTIPIVTRRKLYEKYLPTNSFIAFDDYPNMTAMAEHLHYLTRHPDAYLEYFKWRREGWALQTVGTGNRSVPPTAMKWQGFCRLCQRLVDGNASRPVHTIPDVSGWFFRRSQCEVDGFADSWTANKFRNSTEEAVMEPSLGVLLKFLYQKAKCQWIDGSC